jgi:hypothetical protein
MKRKKILIVITVCMVSLLIAVYFFLSHNSAVEGHSERSFALPKVLILTTGASEGNGVLAQGVVIALQTFNKQGAFVKLDSRNILLDTARLYQFNIMILPTSMDYHDADRKYSLTFLSDEEMRNIKNWVRKGGLLVAGDNTGRNTLENVDRINLLQELTPANWELGECFGVSLKEKNIQGYHVEGSIDTTLKGIFIPQKEYEEWVLVPDSIYSKSLKSLAYWINGKNKTPALLENSYGKGLAFLLPSFYLLHPANEGGYWSADKIEHFYEYVLKEFYKEQVYKIQLNPWPSAHDYAFCVTLNAAGNEQQYDRVLSFLGKEQINPTIFVNGGVEQNMQKLIIERSIQLQSNGFKRASYHAPDYPVLMHDMLLNQIHWKENFKGFRFPFTRTSFWGMMSLNDAGYRFDSSIGADNIDSYYGSVFPYNIPISHDLYYKNLDLLEISPSLNDDYHFYKDLVEMTSENEDQQVKDALLFEKYLSNYWDYAVKPYNGMMVFIGHPLYTGYSDTTMVPMKNLIKKIKNENTWITTIEEISTYWTQLGKFQFNISEGESNSLTIHIDGPMDAALNGLTLKLNAKPTRVKIKKGNYQLVEKHQQVYLVLDAFSGEEITLFF